ncbi:MAG: chorismate mutase [Sulfuricurvum sp. PC08-66]|nr:MAG: chorismate mutase [Sulfuricurvum sp. PC08-66]
MEAKQCQTLSEVRKEIDTLDEQIVALIAARNAYIKQAAKFKISIEEIKDPSRVAQVIDRARSRAFEKGLNPNMITAIYEIMIDEMVESEILEFRNAKDL